MSGVAATLLDWLLEYTYPVAMIAVLTGAIGVPLPTTIVVLAAGAISADGDADPFLLFGAILVAAVVGDLASYSLARWAEGAALQRFGGRVGLTPERLAGVERRFERWGGLLVVVTRCLLTGLALPTNLVAAGSGYPLMRFLMYATLGEAIWAAELVGLGWFYGANWVALIDYLDDFSAALTGLAVAAVLGFVLVRLLRPAKVPAGPSVLTLLRCEGRTPVGVEEQSHDRSGRHAPTHSAAQGRPHDAAV